MSLEDPHTVDAVGVEKSTGHIVLTIADSWDWLDERGHLLALQAKLNTYFEFIETGQVWESFEHHQGKSLVIDVILRFKPPASALELLQRAGEVASQLAVQVRHRVFEGRGTSGGGD
jgi:hypothetical protein